LTNNPPPIARLMLAPRQVRDSAPVGSMAAPADSLSVANGGPGTLSWVAHFVRGDAWLAFVGPNSGTAPATLRIAFNPAGLPMGVYRDTVIVDAENAADSPGRVPVEFTLHPCQPTSVPPNAAALQDSLTTANCSAPHRSKSFARVYSFTGAKGDSISIVMASMALDAYVILDSSANDAVTPLATNDSCTGGNDACLRYQLLPVAATGLANNTAYHWQARALDQTGRAGPWTAFGGNAESAPDFSTSIPVPPNAPTGLGQFQSDGNTAIAVGGATTGRSVILKATVTDSNPGDQLRLDVEAQPVGTAFKNSPSGSGAPVANGGIATATLAGLSDNTAYHWQARAVDQTGRASGWASFGNNAETATDFRVAVAVTQLAFTGQPSNAVAGAAITPVVQVSAQDALGNTITSFTGNVTVSIANNAGGGTLSGTVTIAAVNGVASFSTLSIDKVGSGYTLTAS